MTYTITYTNGDPDREFESYEAAVEAVETEFPDCEIGHAGDLTDDGDRTLFWSDEDEAENDDGARALGSIRRC
jgi:hypothetical protein